MDAYGCKHSHQSLAIYASLRLRPFQTSALSFQTSPPILKSQTTQTASLLSSPLFSTRIRDLFNKRYFSWASCKKELLVDLPLQAQLQRCNYKLAIEIPHVPIRFKLQQTHLHGTYGLVWDNIQSNTKCWAGQIFVPQLLDLQRVSCHYVDKNDFLWAIMYLCQQEPKRAVFSGRSLCSLAHP